MNAKFHKVTSYTWNFQNFTDVSTILVKFDIHFLGLPWEICDPPQEFDAKGESKLTTRLHDTRSVP